MVSARHLPQPLATALTCLSLATMAACASIAGLGDYGEAQGTGGEAGQGGAGASGGAVASGGAGGAGGTPGEDGYLVAKLAASGEVVVDAMRSLGDGQVVVAYRGVDVPGAGRILLTELQPDGSARWETSIQSTETIRVAAVDVDGTGDLVVGGYYTGAMTVAGILVGGEADGEDMFVFRFDADGGYQWGKLFSQALDQRLEDLVISSGALSIAGSYLGSALDETQLPAGSAPRAFVARLDDDFDVLQAQAFYDQADDASRSEVSQLVALPNGALAAGGVFESRIKLGPNSHATEQVGDEDVFFVVIDGTDAVTRSMSYRGTTDETLHGLAIKGTTMYPLIGYAGTLDTRGPNNEEFSVQTVGTPELVLAAIDLLTSVHNEPMTWFLQLPGMRPDPQLRAGVAAADNRVAAAGALHADMVFGGTPLGPPGATADALVVFSDALGTALGAELFPASERARADHVLLDGVDLFLGGHFQGTLTAGGESAISEGAVAAFVLREPAPLFPP